MAGAEIFIDFATKPGPDKSSGELLFLTESSLFEESKKQRQKITDTQMYQKLIKQDAAGKSQPEIMKVPVNF